MAAKPKIDYDRIEAGWRAGILSIQQLAEQYHAETGVEVSKPAISKHFKQLGISRDLSAKIQAKADAKVNELNAVVNELKARKQVVYEKDIIEASANIIANVQIKHRKKLARLHEQSNEYQNALDTLDIKNGAELRSAVQIYALLVDAIAKEIKLEREAYGIDKNTAQTDDNNRCITVEIVRPGQT